MRLLKNANLNQAIRDNFNYTFYIPTNSLYLLEITASAHGWWQNLKNFKSFFSDDDLTLIIDNNIQFPKLNNKKGLFDGEVAWNGNNLKGLSKTNIIIVNLAKGSHTINFIANQNPTLESINIFQIENSNQITYTPQTNNPAQNGDRRQWLNLILVDLALETLTIKAIAKKQELPSPRLRRPKDDTDIKLIIDGSIQKNSTPKSHKDWYWCGRVLNGQEKEFKQTLNLTKGLHYIELWADGETVIEKIELVVFKKNYGPVTEKYVDEVWSVYINGIDKANVASPIKLWSVFFLIPFLIGWPSLNYAYIIEREANDQIYSIKEQILINEDKKTSVKLEGVEVQLNQKDPALFFSILEWRKDWWEKLKVGRIEEGNITWINILEPPSEKYILSARFVNLKGFNNSILEVYGKTHMGYGSLYLYEIKDKEVKLLLKTPAVDSKDDDIWSPDNYEKYGFSICGEVFTSGQLFSDYQDLNNDKIDDIILSGQKEILCDKVDENKNSMAYLNFSGIKVASANIKKIFLWDNKTERYFEK